MSDSSITLASGTFFGFRRGDYVDVDGGGVLATVSERCASGAPFALVRDAKRITKVSRWAMTTRNAHRWRRIERAHCYLEDWILWPLADLRSRLRVRA